MDKEDFSLEGEEEPLFLQVKSRDTLLAGENEICKVPSFVGGARDSLAPTIFQEANVDTGEIKHINVTEVKEIFFTYEQEVKQKLGSTTTHE